jgi:hypothetical protein
MGGARLCGAADAGILTGRSRRLVQRSHPSGLAAGCCSRLACRTIPRICRRNALIKVDNVVEPEQQETTLSSGWFLVYSTLGASAGTLASDDAHRGQHGGQTAVYNAFRFLRTRSNSGGPDRNRTCDTRFRNTLLCVRNRLSSSAAALLSSAGSTSPFVCVPGRPWALSSQLSSPGVHGRSDYRASRSVG